MNQTNKLHDFDYYFTNAARTLCDEMGMGPAMKIDLYLRPLVDAQPLWTSFYGNSYVHFILSRKTFLPTKMH